MSTSTTT
jgi:heat shock 70kDa protein 1/2/6/8